MKKMACIGLVVTMFATLLSGCGSLSQKQIEDKLEEYMQAVYAPESMAQFKEAREDSKQLFTSNVTDRFFVAYTDELSEADKLRTCDTIVIHGAAENQSDGQERYLVKAYLYETPNSKAVIKYFTFIMGESGLVTDFTITDPE